MIYNIYFHPLSSIPGPALYASSRIPYIISLTTGNMVRHTQKLHEKYGPIIRIAPNELTCSHPSAWNDIFVPRPGHLPFLKDKIWWAQKAIDNHLINTEGADHVRMRKMLSPGFTARALKAQEPMVQKYVALLIERLREKDGEVVDVVPWFNYTTFDIFGDLAFGESFNCLENSSYHPWISMLFDSIKAFTVMVSVRYYPWIRFLITMCTPSRLRKVQRDHFQFIRDKVGRRLGWEVQRPDLMSYIISQNEKEKEGMGMTRGEIEATFAHLAVAGSETTATVMNGTVNLLIQHPDVLRRLVGEVRRAFEREEDISFERIGGLEYLNAVIWEGLRLCPPVPWILPRVVPVGGDTVCGIFLPGGV